MNKTKSLKQLKNIKILCVAVFVIIFGIIYLFNSQNKADAGEDESILITDTYESGRSVESEGTQSDKFVVYVCGCVKIPGVYELDEGSRISDAVSLAGGITDEADINSVNMAAYIEDAQKIEIYKKAESTQSNDSTSGGGLSEQSGLININSADKDTLMTLPGIGESRAEAIINYRNESGTFKSVEDIMNVSGIKEAAFNKIKDLIRV